MIVTTTIISVEPEKRTELFQTISVLVDQINRTQGCVMFRHYIDASDENSSLLLAEWETDSALNDYLRSENFAILRGAINLFSTHCTDFRPLVTSRGFTPNQ